MIHALVECVANVSEGRDTSVLRHLAGSFRAADGTHLLDVHADPFHHRAVFTFVAPPDAVSDAAYRLAAAAVSAIDLDAHRGEHPRFGAIDVIPFVPLRGVTMEEAATIARETARRIGDELRVPAYLYGAAARVPERRELPAIRRALARSAGWLPDAGPDRPHPTAGVTVVGARGLLIAFNVVLDTADRRVATAIAREIRAARGGPPGIRALGFQVRGRAQVSMNLTRPLTTGPRAAFDAVAERAAAYGVDVAYSEIVGLAPEAAIPPDATESIRLSEPPDAKSLEARLREVYGDEWEAGPAGHLT